MKVSHSDTWGFIHEDCGGLFNYKEKKMRVDLTGTIRRVGSRVDASGDVVNTLILEVFGPMEDLNALMKCPLLISLEEETGATRD